ncbi:hypothetical protein KIN20_016072 [Parelaphostrongylus tenuis]|uniref:Uncharacterized protein n=1 Tax=Parelaphostrongylus tenuis TaxID=148309 RepID=A0AAD5MFW9_PARTN|nr:hypothetical protein KIN20_016072 [Parelaphostrongylus tenuis]
MDKLHFQWITKKSNNRVISDELVNEYDLKKIELQTDPNGDVNKIIMLVSRIAPSLDERNTLISAMFVVDRQLASQSAGHKPPPPAS